MKLAKENKTLGKLLTQVEFAGEIDIERVYNFFLNPPFTDDYKLEWKPPQRDRLMRFMVEEHDFSRDRMEKIIGKIEAASEESRQKGLGSWLNKG
ncbi:MAG TPA: hypothetical protein VJ044_02845 [Candidatus Hodarchaeales archaeon]|nr:hypothetical protein [Candidatus Hodarchaeales archaeon]